MESSTPDAFFNARSILNNRLLFEKKIQFSSSKLITIGVTPIAEDEEIRDGLLEFNDVMIISTPTNSLTITGSCVIWRLKHTFLNIAGKSEYRFTSNDGDLSVSVADNEDVIMKRRGNQVRMDEYEINRLSIILPLVTNYFSKYGATQIQVFFVICVNDWAEELLTDPLSTIYQQHTDDMIRAVMIEIVLNFIDFFRFIVRITEHENNVLALE